MYQHNRKAEPGETKVSDRHQVDKRSSAKKFGRDARRTKAVNTAPPPMRGGIRL